MYSKGISILLFIVLVLAGCELPFGAQSGKEIASGLEQKDQVTIEPGLLEVLLFGPDRVVPGDSFRVRFQVENNMTSPLRLETGACWGQPEVFFEGEQVPMVGSYQVCTMQLLRWELSAKDTRTRDFDLKAAMNDASGSPEESGRASPGTYALQTTIDWRVEGREIDEQLEGEFEVVSP
jgi:hypothetical protein